MTTTMQIFVLLALVGGTGFIAFDVARIVRGGR